MIIISLSLILRKSLFARTHLANKKLFVGTLLAFKKLLAGNLPAFRKLFTGTLAAMYLLFLPIQFPTRKNTCLIKVSKNMKIKTMESFHLYC